MQTSHPRHNSGTTSTNSPKGTGKGRRNRGNGRGIQPGGWNTTGTNPAVIAEQATVISLAKKTGLCLVNEREQMTITGPELETGKLKKGIVTNFANAMIACGIPMTEINLGKLETAISRVTGWTTSIERTTSEIIGVVTPDAIRKNQGVGKLMRSMLPTMKSLLSEHPYFQTRELPTDKQITAAMKNIFCRPGGLLTERFWTTLRIEGVVVVKTTQLPVQTEPVELFRYDFELAGTGTTGDSTGKLQPGGFLAREGTRLPAGARG